MRRASRILPVRELFPLLIAGVVLAGCRTTSARTEAPPPAGSQRVGVYHRFKLRIAAPQGRGAVHDVHAIFVSPDGHERTVLAFPRGDGAEVRFAPFVPGRWRYRVEGRGEGGVVPLGEGAFEAVPSEDAGPVQHDPRHPHGLITADGKRFVPLGENRINIYDPSWNWNHLGIRDYVKTMAHRGMNTVRVFIVSDVEDEEHPDAGGTKPGVIEPALGKFDEKVSEDFDTLFDAAEENGVYVVLSAFALGFSENDPWKSWHDNPYSAERGGPAQDRYAFFSDEKVKALAKRRLAYLAARYGTSSHLLAIDLLNEPEWDGAIPETLWGPWAEEMAKAWRQFDASGHLVTTGSVGLSWNVEGDERPWWGNPQNDLVQWHLYGKETYEPHALAHEMTKRVTDTWSFDKPVLVGEFAYGGEPKPLYDHTHVGIWTAVMSGAGALAHSAPQFNVDSDEPMDDARGAQFLALRNVLARLDATQALEPVEREVPIAPAGARAWIANAGQQRLVWLLGGEQGYGATVHGARVEVPGVQRGKVRVIWVKDETNEELHTELIEQPGGTLELTAPDFVRHVAAVVEPVPPETIEHRNQPR